MGLLVEVGTFHQSPPHLESPSRSVICDFFKTSPTHFDNSQAKAPVVRLLTVKDKTPAALLQRGFQTFNL